MHSPPIRFDRTWLQSFLTQAETDQNWSTWERFQLAVEATEKKIIPSFESIQCLKQIQGFEPLPHQIEVARRVINEMRGRAILADEVDSEKPLRPV